MRLISQFKKHKKLSLFTILILLGVAGYFLIKRDSVIKVQGTKVQKLALTSFVNAPGETTVDESSVEFAQITANIKELKAKDGEVVNEGDTIVVFDSVALQASVADTWKTYLAAKAAFQTSYADYDYAAALIKAKKQARDTAQEAYNEDKSSAKKETLREAEAAYQSAIADKIELTNKKASLEKAQDSTYATYLLAVKNLNNATVKAPKSGKLILHNIKAGQEIKNGSELFSIVSSKSLKFTAEVDESDISSIQKDQEALVTLDSLGTKELKGKVALIESSTFTTDSGSTAVRVDIEFDSEIPPQILGLNGEAKIKTAFKDGVLALPFEYLEEDDQANFVFAEREGKAEKKRVKTGITSYDFVEILEGIAEGEEVIKGEGLKEGIKVKR